MLDLVDVGESSLSLYRGVAPEDLVDAVSHAAKALKGARVLHLNATPYGGRDPQRSCAPRCPCCATWALAADWKVITGDQALLRGDEDDPQRPAGSQPRELTAAEQETYLTQSTHNGAELLGGASTTSSSCTIPSRWRFLQLQR